MARAIVFTRAAVTTGTLVGGRVVTVVVAAVVFRLLVVSRLVFFGLFGAVLVRGLVLFGLLVRRLGFFLSRLLGAVVAAALSRAIFFVGTAVTTGAFVRGLFFLFAALFLLHVTLVFCQVL